MATSGGAVGAAEAEGASGAPPGGSPAAFDCGAPERERYPDVDAEFLREDVARNREQIAGWESRASGVVAGGAYGALPRSGD